MNNIFLPNLNVFSLKHRSIFLSSLLFDDIVIMVRFTYIKLWQRICRICMIGHQLNKMVGSLWAHVASRATDTNIVTQTVSLYQYQHQSRHANNNHHQHQHHQQQHRRQHQHQLEYQHHYLHHQHHPSQLPRRRRNDCLREYFQRRDRSIQNQNNRINIVNQNSR